MIGGATLARPVPATPRSAGATPGRRFYDPASDAWMIKVYPGEFQVVTDRKDMLVTVLGSCVAACVRDPITGVGGMNHFMLPVSEAGRWGGELMSARFGNFAMEKLVNEMIKRGCPRERLEVKVFGGANVIESQQAVGEQNCDFILRYLEDEGLRCAAQDLGGDYPRRIQYSPSTGRVVRRLLGRNDAAPIVHEEKAYAGKLHQPQKPSDDIELFGNFK